jgi:hypothetical protein
MVAALRSGAPESGYLDHKNTRLAISGLASLTLGVAAAFGGPVGNALNFKAMLKDGADTLNWLSTAVVPLGTAEYVRRR